VKHPEDALPLGRHLAALGAEQRAELFGGSHDSEQDNTNDCFLTNRCRNLPVRRLAAAHRDDAEGARSPFPAVAGWPRAVGPRLCPPGAPQSFRPVRGLGPARHETFDVLVIGGGITGAGARLDAAVAEDCAPALVEPHELRLGDVVEVLEDGARGPALPPAARLRLVYEALHEQPTGWLENAPHLVRSPLPFLIPLFGRDGIREQGRGRAPYAQPPSPSTISPVGRAHRQAPPQHQPRPRRWRISPRCAPTAAGGRASIYYDRPGATMPGLYLSPSRRTAAVEPRRRGGPVTTERGGRIVSLSLRVR